MLEGLLTYDFVLQIHLTIEIISSRIDLAFRYWRENVPAITIWHAAFQFAIPNETLASNVQLILEWRKKTATRERLSKRRTATIVQLISKIIHSIVVGERNDTNAAWFIFLFRKELCEMR